MGFKSKRKRYELDFTGHSLLDGLELTATSTDIATLMKLDELQEAVANASKDEDSTTAAERSAIAQDMFELICSLFRSWNWEEDDGSPRPLTPAGLQRLDQAELNGIIEAYRNALTVVPAPLGRPSTGGEPSPVASLPMEPRSESRAS